MLWSVQTSIKPQLALVEANYYAKFAKMIINHFKIVRNGVTLSKENYRQISAKIRKSVVK
ncbi:protein of unknown function [Chryseobacterium sp. JV274]|nr:protein of unknown function [Chryseobacterium sp. JV274]